VITPKQQWQMETLVETLSAVYSPEGVSIWLDAPRSEWGELTPVEMVDGGRGAEVLERARSLAGGPRIPDAHMYPVMRGLWAAAALMFVVVVVALSLWRWLS